MADPVEEEFKGFSWSWPFIFTEEAAVCVSVSRMTQNLENQFPVSVERGGLDPTENQEQDKQVCSFSFFNMRTWRTCLCSARSTEAEPWETKSRTLCYFCTGSQLSLFLHISLWWIRPFTVPGSFCLSSSVCLLWKGYPPPACGAVHCQAAPVWWNGVTRPLTPQKLVQFTRWSAQRVVVSSIQQLGTFTSLSRVQFPLSVLKTYKRTGTFQICAALTDYSPTLSVLTESICCSVEAASTWILLMNKKEKKLCTADRRVLYETHHSLTTDSYTPPPHALLTSPLHSNSEN